MVRDARLNKLTHMHLIICDDKNGNDVMILTHSIQYLELFFLPSMHDMSVRPTGFFDDLIRPLPSVLSLRPQVRRRCYSHGRCGRCLAHRP